MTTLDYATYYETEFRHRRLRRALMGLLAVIVLAMPVVVIGLSGPG